MKLSLPFLPKQSRFFFLLHESAMNIQKVSRKFQDLMINFENVDARVGEIKELEEFGDKIIHDITHSLYQTFITPIDREDIINSSYSNVKDILEMAMPNVQMVASNHGNDRVKIQGLDNKYLTFLIISDFSCTKFKYLCEAL